MRLRYVREDKASATDSQPALEGCQFDSDANAKGSFDTLVEASAAEDQLDAIIVFEIQGHAKAGAQNLVG